MSDDNHKISKLMTMLQGHLESGAPELAYGIGSAGCRQFPEAEALLELTGLAAAQIGQLKESTRLFESALKLNPDNTRLTYNLATVYQSQGILPKARKLLEACVAQDPKHGSAHANLGSLLCQFGELDLALTHLQESLNLGQDTPEVHTNRGNALRDQGFIPAALEAYQKALALAPSYNLAASNYLLCLNYSSQHTQHQILEAHQAWGARQPQEQPAPFESYQRNRKIRLGYVSPDFRRHSCAYYLRGLFAHHDRSRFEIIAYSNTQREDDVTEFFKQKADVWRPIQHVSTARGIEMVREDKVDILIDLAGHSAHNRLDLFATQIAPIQVTYLGYPNTTGLPAVNFRLGDVLTDPTNDQTSEEVIRLPGCFLCYEPEAVLPEVAAAPFRERGFVTFGSFNTLPKITNEVLDCWADILNGVPQSRLLLKTKQFASRKARERVIARLEKNGISPTRIELRSHVASLHAHLDLYQELDLALDPFPYNGTTTTCEALTMGVPVQVLNGDRHASRVGSSLLTTVGLDSLVRKNIADYRAHAIELGNHPERILLLRDSLRERFLSSALCNPSQHAQSLEASLETLLVAKTR